MGRLLLFCIIGIGPTTISVCQPSHEIFDRLLREHVSATGIVDYKGLILDSIPLNRYLDLLSNNPPDEKKWSKVQQMAYWINAYNAFTIKLVIDHYPVKSIKDIGDKIQIPFVNTPWDIKFIKQGNRIVDLNFIEHGKLRKQDDPRIHMAIVCASKSCPVLLNEAYRPESLDLQLTKQVQRFLADPVRNKITADQLRVSMIFSWYKSDFSRNAGSVRQFINRYAGIAIKPEAKITYLKYDWSLNE
jgi:hypothetical protein